MFLGFGLVTVPLTVLAYKRINATRDHAESLQQVIKEQDGKNEEDTDTAPMGDRRAGFRYTI